ncbi:MAG: hypothetical protein JSW48_13955 [Betaproteobacteria bacterium]|nr:MAG: hypothetical protein JSW48_13955 [Betaproteobacteria bacterium]
MDIRSYGKGIGRTLVSGAKARGLADRARIMRDALMGVHGRHPRTTRVII